MCKGFGDALIVKSNPYSSFNMVKYIILIFGIVIYAHEYSQMKEFGYKPVFVKEYYILIKPYNQTNLVNFFSLLYILNIVHVLII